MDNTFSDLLRKKIISSSKRYYTDNFDHHTFSKGISAKRKRINFGKRLLYTPLTFKLLFSSNAGFLRFMKLTGIKDYLGPLQFFYDVLEDQRSKDLLVDLVAYRALDYVKMKLDINNAAYWEGLEKMIACADTSQTITLDYPPYTLYKHDIRPFGYPIDVFIHSYALYTTVGMQHYRRDIEGGRSVRVEPGDIALDLGGCYGDTSMVFAHDAGPEGKVLVYEFIPQNIEVIKKNLSINPDLKDRVTIVPHPVWDESDKATYFKDAGAKSRISFEEFEGMDGSTTTLSVDDCVERYGLERVDFIKTDVEGAEPWALRGAEKTLRKYRPKLAVSIYHGMGDFTGLVKQIHDMNLGYKFYIDHATIHASETVLFCMPEGK